MLETYIASILWISFNFAPMGTIEANGQCLPINNNNAALFSLLGTRYGGDGRTNFCVPDMRPVVNGQRDNNWNNGPRAVIITQGIYPSRP